MNKRLIDKHAVSFISSERYVALSAESSSEIAAIILLGRIFEKNVSRIHLPQAFNSSWEFLVDFTCGDFVYIYWYESDGLRFNFYFLPEDWAKLQEMMK